MSQSPDFSRFLRTAAVIVLTTFSLQCVAEEAILVVNRVAADEYAVVRAPGTTPIGKDDIVIKTKYCHEYSYNEDVVLTSKEDGGENALLFASGAQCEVVAVSKKSDNSFNLLDFLIQLGLLALTGKGRAKPVPKR
jgi:hypothetical protein